MPEILFGRFATLYVGVPGRNGRDLSGLRFSFEVTKTLEGTANAAKILVWNLSQETRTFIEKEAAGTKKFVVLLSCGYSGLDDVPTARGIFRGDILRVEHQKQSGDIITTIETADEIKAIANSTVNLSYKEGTSLSTILRAAASSLGVSVGEIQGLDGKQFLRGYSASGKASSQLDLIAEQANADWSIQDGVLQLIQRDKSLPGTVISLNSNTGLLGSPNKRQDDKGNTEIQFTTLLQPKLVPGARVQLDSRFVRGVYKIQKLTHKGDTRQGGWFSEVEAR